VQYIKISFVIQRDVMSTFNPIIGGPAYLQMLGVALSAWELQSGYTPTPPSAGGEQFSVRMAKDKQALLEVIAKRSGWSRNQVLIALVDRSLAELFEGLNDPTGNAIRDDMLELLFPGQSHNVP
jgi:hypothetical protein